MVEMRIWITLFLCFFPYAAFAAEGLTRQDGFIAIWDSIHRPAKEVSETPFTDVQEGSRGFTEITYAKNRGILEDHSTFYPTDPLTKEDAVFWLFRTRNVDDLDGMQREDFSRLLQKYPVITEAQRPELIASMAELQTLIAQFDTLRDEEIHEVSYYADDFHGAGTAFGETFDMYAMTAAHRTFPHNTLVRVTNLDNDKSVILRINDRGPYVHGRSLDLSLAGFEAIAPRSRGVLRNVRIERLGDAGLLEGIEPGQAESLPEEVLCPGMPKKRYQKRITRDVRFHRGIPHTLVLGDTLVLGSTKFFVVRWVQNPDSSKQRVQEWVGKKERYRFTPSQNGEYTFYVGTGFGRAREMFMTVESCSR